MSNYKSPGRTAATRSPGRVKSSGTLASMAGAAPGGAARGAAGKLAACLAYGAVSVSITMFNKAVFSVYHFEYPAFVTTLQVALSIVFMLALSFFGVLDIGPRPTVASARAVAPLAILWMLYVQSGVIALRYLTVPMYSVLRRATTLLVVAGEYFAFGKVPTPPAAAAIGAMAAGAAIAGSADLSFSAIGYAWVGVCVVATAAYLILIRLLGDKTGLNQHALLFHNNLLSLPLMAAWFLLATDEPAGVAAAPQLRDPRFCAFLAVSASQAFLLNLCIFWCTTINSPLATTVTGQMKDILTTGLGLFLFGDVLFNSRNLAGVALGLGGGIAYSLLALQGKGKKEEVKGSPVGKRGRP